MEWGNSREDKSLICGEKQDTVYHIICVTSSALQRN